MVESLKTRSASALAAVNAVVGGSSEQLCSSRALRWDGVHLEHHRKFPVERREAVSPHHAIALFTSHVRGESAASQSRYVPYSCSPGAIFLFPAGPIGVCRLFTEAAMTVCALDPLLVAEVREELDRPPLTEELRTIKNLRDQSLEGILKLLVLEAYSGGVSGRLYADYLVHALALRFRQLSAGTQVTGPSRFEKMPGLVLRRVLDRMKAEFATDLDLKTIAAESGYSRTHFLRIFRASTGYSPHQWLIHLRIEEAKTLLQKASNSLIDIALDCGFSSHGHFTSTFRKIVGVTPREYRHNFV